MLNTWKGLFGFIFGPWPTLRDPEREWRISLTPPKDGQGITIINVEKLRIFKFLPVDSLKHNGGRVFLLEPNWEQSLVFNTTFVLFNFDVQFESTLTKHSCLRRFFSLNAFLIIEDKNNLAHPGVVFKGELIKY